MSVIRGLAAATVLSVVAVAGLAVLSVATGQNPGPVRASLMPPAHVPAWDWYWSLAAAPFGNGPALFALVAFIYTACLMIVLRRRARRQQLRRNQ